MSSEPLYLGLDLSTQQLKCLAITGSLSMTHEEIVTFDSDLPQYGTKKGVHTDPAMNEVTAPVAMWIEALDLVLGRMKKAGVEFGRVRGVSGAGQQHGSVFWGKEAEGVLGRLDAGRGLVEQLGGDGGVFTWERSPNWQDHSTQAQCDAFEERVGGEEVLAGITGSKAHHRFTGPQILRFYQRFPELYEKTSRISLVSSFLCSMFLGRIAPVDISDVCGMNLWDMRSNSWSQELLDLAAPDLKSRLGDVEVQPGKHLGPVSGYFVERYGFNEECVIAPFTGDNPSTILALPLRPLDAIISLGTSTTLLMATPTYFPSPSYHLFNHPTDKGLYMFMLCYCNGALAREKIRDEIATSTTTTSDPWKEFNEKALSTTPLGKSSKTSDAKLGIYFPIPEIVPNVRAGTWRYNISPTGELKKVESFDSGTDARAILESQALSMRLRANPLLSTSTPAQPRRVYLVGGASKNPAITKVLGQVLGGKEGVYRLDVGGNACALGAAYYAAWAVEGRKGKDEEGFEDFVAERWEEGGRIVKVGEGYEEGVWEGYGDVLGAFEEVERRIGMGE
ncbi:actin-like ATPase domain-containing protein [Choiromyces venosus 120613-1]|uniref:Xylulose kinase n=1 Tax=Choiromyces venosus 120613-1 TaxID=1336337 RepID=A0A3N4JDA6_9PEZI|nr:actin-like ATPase domain-containing protein [Choiromyces venosus 120613-1]